MAAALARGPGRNRFKPDQNLAGGLGRQSVHLPASSGVSGFFAPGRTLTFHNYHSREAYEYVAQGLVDIALISDHMYHPQVETVPAFRSAMVLVTGGGVDWPDTVHPAALDPTKELRLPWNPEYDLWHAFWFSTAAVPRAVLDQMSLLEEFFSWQDNWPDSWAIVPAVVAVPLSQKLGLTLRTLKDGPADEIIYYLQGARRGENLNSAFLACLNRELAKRPETESLLPGDTFPTPVDILPGYESNHIDHD